MLVSEPREVVVVVNLASSCTKSPGDNVEGREPDLSVGVLSSPEGDSDRQRPGENPAGLLGAAPLEAARPAALWLSGGLTKQRRECLLPSESLQCEQQCL